MKTLKSSHFNERRKKLFLILLSAFFLIYSLASVAQTGSWNNANETTTGSDVGIGINTPDGKTEIKYDNPLKNGLVVTRVFNTNPGGGIEVVTIPTLPPDNNTVPININAGYFNFHDLKLLATNVNEKPIMIGRTFDKSNNIYKNLFLLAANGTLGLNNDNPRATLDIVSKRVTYNYPTALFGLKTSANFNYTRHIQIINRLSEKGYSNLSQDGDQGIFWTDGTGSCSQTIGTETETVAGTNKASGLVIAPWNHSDAGIKINGEGNIGIGTATPRNKLDVNGKIYCKSFEVTNPGGYTIMKITPNGYLWAQEIKVRQGDPWPDFVFNINYPLMSLSELQLFINTNKQLPSMPTEKEIIENGQDLGKMNTLLLQKIEEMTLYILEINKRLEIMEKQEKP